MTPQGGGGQGGDVYGQGGGPPPPRQGWPARAWAAFRRWPMWVQVVVAGVGGLFLLGLIAAPFTADEADTEDLRAARSVTTDEPAATTTSEAPTTTEPTTTAEPTTTTTEPTTTTTEPTTTTAEEGPRADEETGEDVWSIGQTATTGDLDVFIHQVADPWTSTNQFDVPAAGNRFVAIEVEATNTADDTHTISTLTDVELTDSLDRVYTVALAGVGLQDLGGDVQPGGARRGWVVFEVPSDATGLHLRIKGNFTATGSLFDLSTG